MSELNEGQLSAYNKLVEFIDAPGDEMFLLEGYAGTGKTFLVGKLLEYILKKKKYWDIAVTAPTNKAVKVLERSALTKSYKVQFATIHKLLGLKEEITSEGKQVFKNDSMDEVSIENYNLLILDEVSMLNDELFLEIIKYNKRVKVIFMGDPAQIPPVNKTDCIPFLAEGREKYKIQVCLLTEIMRQKEGNPIIAASFELRENLNSDRIQVSEFGELNCDGMGIIRINSGEENERAILMDMLESHFNCEAFKADADHAKVIAWRNVTISKMNVLIRGMLFKNDIKKIMVGEKLIANKPIIQETNLMKTIIFTTNDEFEVSEYSVKVDKTGFVFYDTSVTSITLGGQKITNKVHILHEDSEQEFSVQLEKKRKAAIGETNFFLRKDLWKMYYAFLRKFADVGYNYAITGHKSQGSTYKNVFLLEDDINQNKNIVERNRIKYTCVTRPTDKLFVVKR